MSLATRCPNCNTLFRVTPRDLKARAGEVRCGRCQTVFDGFSRLVTLPDAANAPVPPPPDMSTSHPVDLPPAPDPAPAVEPQKPATVMVTPEPEPSPPVVEVPAPAESPAVAVPEPAAMSAATEPIPEPMSEAAEPAADEKAEPDVASVDALPEAHQEVESAEPPVAGDASASTDLDYVESAAPASAAGDADIAKPESGYEGPEAREEKTADPMNAIPAELLAADVAAAEEDPARRRHWIAICALTGLVLALNAAYVFRGDLVARLPQARPLAEKACAALGCRIVLPQRHKQIAIEASDLQVPDPARPGSIRLTATLRNHAGYTVGFPALDLVLTNRNDHTLARRVFLPQEYLERGRDPLAGMPASAEVTIQIDLETGDLNAAGFRLDLLPSP